MKRLLQAFILIISGILAGGTCRADIISVSPGHALYSAGPIANAEVDFTNFGPSGCPGVRPCIVGASLIPITLFESGFSSTMTFTYGPEFDFDYLSTGPGDRLILEYHNASPGFSLNLNLNGASFYLAPPPLGIPDYGTPGISSCPTLNSYSGLCYTFSNDLTATSGRNSLFLPQLPYNSPFTNEIDVYVAINGLDPNGGTFSITQSAGIAPEPSSFVLLGTGIIGMAGVARRKLMS